MENNQANLLELAMTGQRHQDQLDYEWRWSGHWIMLQIRSVGKATAYPFKPGQIRHILKSYELGRNRQHASRMNKCGWTLQKTGDVILFEAHGMRTETKLTLSKESAAQFFGDMAAVLEKDNIHDDGSR